MSKERRVTVILVVGFICIFLALRTESGRALLDVSLEEHLGVALLVVPVLIITTWWSYFASGKEWNWLALVALVGLLLIVSLGFVHVL